MFFANIVRTIDRSPGSEPRLLRRPSHGKILSPTGRVYQEESSCVQLARNIVLAMLNRAGVAESPFHVPISSYVLA